MARRMFNDAVNFLSKSNFSIDRLAMRVTILILVVLFASRACAQEATASSCTPIGLTAAGELVFPMSCEPVLAKIRGPAGTENPDAKSPEVAKAPEAKPAEKPAEKKDAMSPPPATIEAKPADKVEVVSPPPKEKEAAPVPKKKLAAKQRRTRQEVETTGSVGR